eukprot:c12888_g1_i1.p1 GENE.c12888_g1_i1~~c12888_g1_i1.p1  ORF type:complete len:493 (-),score=197.78 c12888_g1_i1:156-1634(-)
MGEKRWELSKKEEEESEEEEKEKKLRKRRDEVREKDLSRESDLKHKIHEDRYRERERDRDQDYDRDKERYRDSRERYRDSRDRYRDSRDRDRDKERDYDRKYKSEDDKTRSTKYNQIVKKSESDEDDDESEKEDSEKKKHEDKIAIFKAMLKERGVKPFSKWEKDLPKIHFDPRFSIISDVKERKAIFEHYVKHAAVEEKIQQKETKQMQKEKFKELLSESDLNAFSTFEEFEKKAQKDKRFEIDKKERKILFDEFLQPIKKNYESKLHQIKVAFCELLKEKGVNERSQWSSIHDLISDDPRYYALDSSIREETFKKYKERCIEELAAERVRMAEIERRRVQEENERYQREVDNKRRNREIQEEVSRWTKKKDNPHAIKALTVILEDIFTSKDMSYEEVIELLKKDKRYSAIRATEEQQKSAFDSYLETLIKKQKDSLDDLVCSTNINISTKWEDFKLTNQSHEKFQIAGEKVVKECFDEFHLKLLKKQKKI